MDTFTHSATRGATAMDVMLLFPTNLGTMVAGKTLRDAGVPVKMIPTPAAVSSSSNLCLTIDRAVEAHAVATLAAAKVSLSSILR